MPKIMLKKQIDNNHTNKSLGKASTTGWINRWGEFRFQILDDKKTFKSD